MALDNILAIVNPVAGKGKCTTVWSMAKQYLRELGVEPLEKFTAQKGDAVQLAREAVQSGVQAILAVGGDGTLNEVVNGAAGAETNIGVIPAGSGNDFIRTLGLRPNDWRGACQLVASGQTVPIDLGRVNGRHFINVAGVGFDAAVANCANLWAKQRFPGSAAYLGALFKVLAEFHPVDVEIALDGEKHQGQSWLVAVANAQYFGGGMWIAPNANPRDGLFDVIILGELSKPGFLRAFPSVFSGQHLSHPAIHSYRASSVKVMAAAPLLVQADGELIGQTPIDFRIFGQKLHFYSRRTEA